MFIVYVCVYSAVFPVYLFIDNMLFTHFAFLMICSSARKTEFNFGRRPIYSAIGVPAHSSLILPLTFLFVSL